MNLKAEFTYFCPHALPHNKNSNVLFLLVIFNLSCRRLAHLKLFVGQPAVFVRIRVVEHLINVVVRYRHRKVTHQVPKIILR